MTVLNHIPEKLHDHITKGKPCVLQFRVSNKSLRNIVCEGFDFLKTIDPPNAKPFWLPRGVSWNKLIKRLWNFSRLYCLLKQIDCTLSDC